MIDFDGLVLASAMSVFGEWVTHYPRSGLPLAVQGVFDDRYREIKFAADGVEVVTVQPVLGARVSSFIQMPLLADVFQVRGRFYAVAQPPEADGLGHVKIALRLATDIEAQRALTAADPVTP